MDAPLLALTRQPSPAPIERLASDTARANMRQLVQLRWLAVGGQLLTVLVVRFALNVHLPLAPMIGVIALLALANLVSTLILTRRRVSNGQLRLALLLDMGALTAQLYLSGGADNPFISLYLLQVVLGAILLDVRSVWILLGVASLALAGLTVRSAPLAYPPGLSSDIADLHAFGVWVSFALTATLLGLFVTRITRNLRARDRYLADVRQQAAEEDGIVRMGLFASGAAHELGTPLSSVSVILSDWRRVPRLADDPELSGELDEMMAEVQRCKEIVSGILHSAGAPRGDALASVAAQQFLDEVVAAWHPPHGTQPLHYATSNLDGALLVTDLALRQAIWNLLDNAAEASPDWLSLTASAGTRELTIAVADRGPGFTSMQLATIGKLFPSSKGAGHGLGLFLATNVARRLGGQLAAINRPEGGALVTMIVPFASGQRA